MSSAKSTRISGTKEWSVESVNVVFGCPHRCRYCYARARALRFCQIAAPGDWGTSAHRLRPSEIRKRRKPVDGRVMFPTTHDITPEFLQPCLDVIGRILAAGNELLIVSKPHLSCIKAICRQFVGFRESILFRFTIGAVDDRILGYWEPGAPAFSERLESLKHAHAAGFATSVSAEPLLDAPHVVELVDTLEPYVTDSIWIGKMNGMGSRLLPGTEPREIARIEAGQTDESVRAIYARLKGHPLVKWKESYKEVLGLELVSVPGLDV